MTTFSHRIKLASDHEVAVRAMLEERGWACEPFGQALLSERMRELLRRTRSAIRWLPDIIACNAEWVILVDAKESQRLDTANWSIEQAAYDAGSLFQSALGHPLLYVWHDFTANFHDALVFVNDEPWSGRTQRTMGSGTPYWLIRKSQQRSLDDVLSEATAAA